MSDELVLELPREPASARRARAWVTDQLRMLGRDDLVDAAALGVSELVTNAILHTDSPITVLLRGTPAHPRIEVQDSSLRPVRVNGDMTAQESLMSTVGRGLGLVALHAANWGSEIADDSKLIWFEPAEEAHWDIAPAAEEYDLNEIVDDLLTGSVQTDDRDGSVGSDNRILVRLLDMPVQLFSRYRVHYTELVRELRLLALAGGTDYPLAREINELAVEVERDRRQSMGPDDLHAAENAGRDRVDLEYLIPPGAPARMSRMLELLEASDEFCRDQRLLAMPPDATEVALRRWYLGEFARQGAGEQPVPWPCGSSGEEDPA